jgi:hypothetical protein
MRPLGASQTRIAHAEGQAEDWGRGASGGNIEIAMGAGAQPKLDCPPWRTDFPRCPLASRAGVQQNLHAAQKDYYKMTRLHSITKGITKKGCSLRCTPFSLAFSWMSGNPGYRVAQSRSWGFGSVFQQHGQLIFGLAQA